MAKYSFSPAAQNSGLTGNLTLDILLL